MSCEDRCRNRFEAVNATKRAPGNNGQNIAKIAQMARNPVLARLSAVQTVPAGDLYR
jgi:hypothetical protein